MKAAFERGDLADMCAASANFLLQRIAVRAELEFKHFPQQLTDRMFAHMLGERQTTGEVLYIAMQQQGWHGEARKFEDEAYHTRAAFEVYACTFRGIIAFLMEEQAARANAEREAAEAEQRAKQPPPHRGVFNRVPRFGSVRLGMRRIGRDVRVLVRRVKAPGPGKPPKPPRGPSGKFVKRT